MLFFNIVYITIGRVLIHSEDLGHDLILRLG